MGALKEGIAYLRDAISRNGKCAAVPADMVLALWEDVSDRIDEDHKRMVDNSKRLDALEQQAHRHDSQEEFDRFMNECAKAHDDSLVQPSVAQDERGCENCGAGHMECHTDGVRPYCDEWQPKQPKAQDKRSCDEYELPDLYHAGVIKPKAQEQFIKYCGRPDIKCHALTEGNRCMSGVCPNSVKFPVLQSPPKAQEQGGDDLSKFKFQICVGCGNDPFEKMDCRVADIGHADKIIVLDCDDLRARLAEAERINVSNCEDKAKDMAKIARLEAENDELKRDLKATRDAADMTIAELKRTVQRVVDYAKTQTKPEWLYLYTIFGIDKKLEGGK